MAIEISPQLADELNVQLIALFEQGGQEAAELTSDVLSVCYLATSDTVENVYTFAPEVRGLRDRPEGTNEMVIDAVKLYDGRLVNKDKYRAISVQINDFRDDKIGKYRVVFLMTGESAAVGPSREVESVIVGAESIIGYDDVAFYSDAHPRQPKVSGSPTWSNKFTKASGLTFTTFGEVFSGMMAFPDEDGKSAGSRPNILAISPDDLGMGMDITTNEFPSGLSGGKNPWLKYGVELMVVPNWAGLGFWDVYDIRSSWRRPFVFQEREQVAILPLYTNPDGAYERLNRQLLWLVEGRFAAGVGYPNKAARVRKTWS
jgi:phage major head subunit gpT-like protein